MSSQTFCSFPSESSLGGEPYQRIVTMMPHPGVSFSFVDERYANLLHNGEGVRWWIQYSLMNHVKFESCREDFRMLTIRKVIKSVNRIIFRTCSLFQLITVITYYNSYRSFTLIVVFSRRMIYDLFVLVLVLPAGGCAFFMYIKVSFSASLSVPFCNQDNWKFRVASPSASHFCIAHGDKHG